MVMEDAQGLGILVLRGWAIDMRSEPEELAEVGNDEKIDSGICSWGIPIMICSSCLIVQSVRKAELR